MDRVKTFAKCVLDLAGALDRVEALAGRVQVIADALDDVEALVGRLGALFDALEDVLARAHQGQALADALNEMLVVADEVQTLADKLAFVRILTDPVEAFDNALDDVQVLANALNRPDPVDNDGEWVLLAEFKRRSRADKSFGYYVCSECSKGWMSAHARPGYRQECKACNCWEWPLVMWVNAPGAARKDKDPDTPRARHMAELCEACLAGDLCLGSLRIDDTHRRY